MQAGIGPHLSRTRYDAVIFDLDGVITRTAKLHARAWKHAFDEFLEKRSRAAPSPQAPFDPVADYLRFVDGKPRYDGVQSFLESRDIRLPRGQPTDPVTAETLCGLGNRKNQLFEQLLEQHQPEVYEHAIDLIARVRAAGLRTAVVSSSEHCVTILQSVHALEQFDAKVDGRDAGERRLAGKPAPDIYLAAAAALGVAPARTVVIEDALAGVAAARAGDFGLVVGVDRGGQAEALRAHGADYVVDDLAALAVTE